MAPTGYQVGTAWVQVLPSFDTFQKRSAAFFSNLSDLKVDLQPVMSASAVQKEVASAVKGTTATVDVKPHVDTKAVNKELSTIKPPTMTVTPKVNSKAATKELKKLGESTVVTVSPDTSDLDAKLRELESRRTVAVIAIDADLTKTRARIEELNRAKLHKDVDVDADITEYKETIKGLLRERAGATVNVTLDTLRARTELVRLRKSLTFKHIQLDANIEKAKARIKALRKAAEEDETLNVVADVTNAELQIEHFQAQKRSASIEMSAKIETARARLRDLETGKYRTTVEVDADLADARAKLAELQALKPLLTVDVDAELAAAEARIDYLTAKREVVEIQADLDIARAKAKLEELDNGLSRIRNNQTDINMEASDASRAITIIGALTAAIGALGYVAPAAAAAVSLIPAAILGAAQGFAAVAAGFRGIGEASDAMQAVEDEAASRSSANSAARIAATKRIASAESALRQALEGADRSAIRSAQQVTQAREGVAEAQADSLRRVQDAERSLESAQMSALDAQLALTRARKDAAEQAEDLRISVAGAALDEEAAVLAVQRAQERLTAAREAGATGRDLQEVDLSARQAAQSLVEIRERYGDLREEAAEASRQGVAGNAQVVSAQRQVEESTQRVHEAEQSLSDARIEGTKQVAKAQERLAQAQQQASWAAADASHAVAEAQRALAEAAVDTGIAGTAAMDKLSLAMSKLGPAGQSFVNFLHNEGKPALEELGTAAAETMLPKVEAAFGTLLTMLPEVKAALADAGDVIGDLAIKGADMVTTGPWRQDFLTIAARSNRMLGLMGESGLSLLDTFRHLSIASGPLAEAIAASAEASVNQFEAWIEGKRASGELAVWFNEMGIRARELWEVLRQLAGGVFDVVGALAPLGRVILEIIGPLAEMIGNFAEANPTLTTVIGLAVLLGSSFVSLFRTIGGMTQAVRTSKGVFDNLVFGMRGTQETADKATDATGRLTTATGRMSGAVERGTGLVGKIGTGLHNVSAAYTQGATRADAWATRTSAAVGGVGQVITTQLVPAVTGGVRQIDSFLPATQRVEGGFRNLSTVASTTLGGISRAVGGAATAVTKGLAGAVTGLVGALGGPFGLAIAAATIGLGFLASSQAEAAQEAAAHKAQIQSLTDALTESGGVVDDNVRKQIRLSLEEKSVADNARNLGLNVGTMIRAISEGGTVASNFETDLYGVGMEMIRGKGLGSQYSTILSDVIKEMLAGGGQASDYAGEINTIAREYGFVTGASEEATAEFKNQLTQLLDLAGGYQGASGDFLTAEQQQKDIADAQGDAATETERHTSALKALNDAVLGSVNKDLAHREALNALAQAQARTAQVANDAKASTEDLTAARLAEEQAVLRVITTAGELAYANSTASTDIDKQREALLAQAQAAADLANTYEGPLPASLQTYLDQLFIAKTATGEYKVVLDSLPKEALTTAVFDDKIARDKLLAWSNLNPSKDYPGPLPRGGGALGAIAIPAYALGGMRSMSARHAQVVPPNTPRIIGDRMRGDEAFIPINTEPRSIGILADAAQRMGFALMPLFAGAILGMANGGLNQAAAPAAGGTDGAALTLAPVALADFTVAVQQMIATALVPLANEVNGTTVPALASFEDHAGTGSVNAINELAGLLPPLQVAFAVTAAAIEASWASVRQSSTASVSAINGQLAALRQSVQGTGTAFSSTSDWIGTTWARITAYTADPVRAALAGPYNSGLIPAWNYLSTFFNLGRPLAPMAIPFASGGKVPGVGNQDTVPAMLTPGEYVVPKPVVKKWGVGNLRAAHMATLRGGFSGLEGMLVDDPLYRVGYASGGPVPEALARAAQFGQRMHGKPYIWGGSSEAGTDCSGWMAMLARALVDEKPYARREWATGQTAGGRPPPRFAGGIEGLFAIGVNPGSHTAGTLAGRNVESGGAHNFVAFGPPSKGADHSSFPLKFHLPEIGGQFVSGGGGEFDLSTFIRDAFDDTYRQVGAYQSAWGGNMMTQAGAALTSQAADAIMSHAVNTISPMGSSGNVESWRPLVLQALKMLGLPEGWADITLRRMNQESGGNPRAVNNWDSNAARGDPSKGLMQVIGSTFRAYRDSRAPDDVFDPLANLLASMKYATSRWGSLPAAYGRAGGYDSGGYLPPGYNTVYNGLSRPEAVLTDNQWNALITMATSSSSGGEFRGNLYLSSGEFMGVVQGEIDRAQGESGRALARRIR